MTTAILAISITAIMLGVLRLLVTRPSWLSRIQLGLNVLVSLPMVVLLVMKQSGAHPTRQLNPATGTSMDWWSFWVEIWPLSMLLLLGAIVVAFVLLAITTADVIRTTPRHHVVIRIIHSTLCVAQPVMMLFFIGQNFPDA